MIFSLSQNINLSFTLSHYRIYMYIVMTRIVCIFPLDFVFELFDFVYDRRESPLQHHHIMPTSPERSCNISSDLKLQLKYHCWMRE